MEKKKDSKMIIFWVLGIGGLAYAIYNAFSSKGKTTSTDGSELANIPTTNPTTGKTYSAYEMRVMYLQTLLGVKVDGIVGKQTTLDLTEKYLGKLTYGGISPTNIEKYISEVKNHNTPYELKIKADALLKTSADAEKVANSIIDAYKNNPKSVLNFNNKYAVNGHFQCYQMLFNKANNVWEYTGQTFSAAAGKRTRDGGVPVAVAPNYYNALVVRVNYKGVYTYILMNPTYVQVV